MDTATLEQAIRKLKREAAERAMELHDLTEELPGAYARILEVAQRTYDKHLEFIEARNQLEQSKKENGG